MTDALCGPSNALQNFQKHTHTDRTLQQDRLISRAGPSQSFRSPAQNAGILDPEFEAFQAGQPSHIAPLAAPSPFFQQHLPQRSHTPLSAHAHAHAPQSSSPIPDWAADFQRMNITSAPAHAVSQDVHQSAFTSAAPASSSYMSAGPAFGAPMFESSYSNGMMGGFAGNMGMGLGMNMGMMPGQAEQEQRMHEPEQQMPVFDDAAFAAAFDDAAMFLGTETTVTQADVQQAQYEMDALMQSEEELDALMSGALQGHDTDISALHEVEPIVQEETQQGPEPLSEGDALARTAGMLLESVSEDQSDKFAKSSFLELMRRLRDHEVTVEGENFFDSSTHAIANTTGELSSELDPAPQSEPENISIPSLETQTVG